NSNYASDVTNNPFHGYESFKIPNLFQYLGQPSNVALQYDPQYLGGIPIDNGALTAGPPPNAGGAQNLPASFVPPNSPTVPATFPTYDAAVNSRDRLDGVNEADEINLYSPNPLLDSPYTASDLEWLYRHEDIDGASLSSRLAQL